MPNKVRFGLKNVHYATVTFAADGTPSYATPVRIPGAVNMSLSKKSEDAEFYADDGIYFEVGDNSAFDGELEIALVPQGFRTDVLGEVLDNKGMLVEYAVQNRTPFALLFEFAADAKAVRHVIYNCTASHDETAGQTKGEKIEVKTETLKLKARPLPKSGKVKTKTGDSADSTEYDNWYNSVYMTADGTLATLTVTSVAGTASGDSKITVSGYTLGSGEKWMYKTATSDAPSVSYGDTISDGWTQLTSGSDITPTSGHTKIAVVAVNSSNKAIAYGSATIVKNT